MTDTPSTQDARWVLRARALLQQSAQDLDAATLSRLNRARQTALDRFDHVPRERSPLLRWAGVAAISVGIGLIAWQASTTTHAPPNVAHVSESITPPALKSEPAASAGETSLPVSAPDFERLADADGYVLLEDLEFYAWLEAAGNSGG
jgi:hypothetical protein